MPMQPNAMGGHSNKMHSSYYNSVGSDILTFMALSVIPYQFWSKVEFLQSKGGKCLSDSITAIYLLKLCLLRELGLIKGHKVTNPSKPVSAQIRVNSDHLEPNA